MARVHLYIFDMTESTCRVMTDKYEDPDLDYISPGLIYDLMFKSKTNLGVIPEYDGLMSGKELMSRIKSGIDAEVKSAKGSICGWDKQFGESVQELEFKVDLSDPSKNTATCAYSSINILNPPGYEFISLYCRQYMMGIPLL